MKAFKQSRTVMAITLTALVATSAPVASRTVIRPPLPDTPVRCNIGAVNYDQSMGARTRQGASGGFAQALPPPPPPPPAPPPPPPMTAAPKNEVVVTGRAMESRRPQGIIAQPGYYLPPVEDRERYAGKEVAAIKQVAEAPVSTFSIDVDTGAYANVRRFLTQGQTPPVAAVRTEEMLNYFRYDYPLPQDRSRPFSVTADVTTTPWNAETRLLRIGLRGYDLRRDNRPPANLVFLVDVSGSMMSQDKLPLVKTSLAMLADRLSPKDRVSIVVYAGAAGVVLEPTNNGKFVKAALDCLQAGGSTAGGQGMELAYAIARAHRISGGVNRVIMATDGDFNVGVSSNDGIEALVKRNREDGITLTTLGFGQGNYNEAMMERVADVGNGNYAYIDTAMEAQKVLDEEMESTLFTIAKDVKIQLEFNPSAVSQYRLIGYENRILNEEDFDNDKVDAGDVGAGHQVTALYEIVPAGAKGWTPERRYEANRTSQQERGDPRELAWLKLRYKLPDGDTSRLIEQPVPAGLVRTASAPRGDMAFAVAVAAFGQKLRGDNQLGGFTYANIRDLAGSPSNFWRAEFVKLTSLAEARLPGGERQAALD